MKDFITEEMRDRQSWENTKKEIATSWKKDKHCVFKLGWDVEHDNVKINLTNTTKTTILLAESYLCRGRDNDNRGQFVDRLFLYGDNARYTPLEVYQSYRKSYYIYSTVIDGHEYSIFSENKINTSVISFKGLLVTVRDSSKNGTKKSEQTSFANHIFIYSYKNATYNEANVVKACQTIRDSKDLYRIYFGDLRQPPMFEDLILAWNIHHYFDYPMHLLVISEKGGYGKTSLEERLEVLNQTVKFKGTESTLKGLIPSYKSVPYNPGFLLKQKETCLIDEFFKLLERYSRHEDMNDSLGLFNSLLEHDTGATESGTSGSVENKCSCRVAFFTNPISGKAGNMEATTRYINEQFLQRLMVYFIPENQYHCNFINSNRFKVDNVIKKNKHTVCELPMYDYLQILTKIEVVYSEAFSTVLYEKCKNIPGQTMFNEELGAVFKNRLIHRIGCMTDAILKIRNIERVNDYILANVQNINNDDFKWKLELELTSEINDYLFDLFQFVFTTWVANIDTEYLMKLSIPNRLKHCSSMAVEVFYFFEEQKCGHTLMHMKEVWASRDKGELGKAIVELLNLKLLQKDEEGIFYPHWYTAHKQGVLTPREVV